MVVMGRSRAHGAKRQEIKCAFVWLGVVIDSRPNLFLGLGP